MVKKRNAIVIQQVPNQHCVTSIQVNVIVKRMFMDEGARDVGQVSMDLELMAVHVSYNNAI